MKKVFIALLSISLFSACLKEESLEPSIGVGPTFQLPFVADTTNNGGGTTGGGSNDPEFFNYTLNGSNVNLSSPTYISNGFLAQITSQLSQSNFFQMVVISGSTFPDTITLSQFSTELVYNETISKRYNAEKGMLIYTADDASKVTGSFNNLTMFNMTNAADSIIVTNGSFSVNK